MPEDAPRPNDQEMISVPASLLRELLEANRSLEARVSGLEHREQARLPANVGRQPHAFDLTHYAASTAMTGVRLIDSQIHEGGDADERRIAQLVAKAELLEAAAQIVRPYKSAFEFILHTRATPVRRLPEPPAKGSPASKYERYITKHAKEITWEESLPNDPKQKITYSVRYLPASSKITASSPQVVSFSSNAPKKVGPPGREIISCGFVHGDPVLLKCEETFLGNAPYVRTDDFRFNADDMKYERYLVNSEGNVEHVYETGTYDETRMLFVGSGSDNYTLSPRDFLHKVSYRLSLLPTMQSYER